METNEFPPVGFAYQGAETTSMGQAIELSTQGTIKVLHNKVYLEQHLLIIEQRQTSNFITNDFGTKICSSL